MTQTPTERQTVSRIKKKAAGFVRTTLRLDDKTIGRLRRLAKRNNTTQANVVALALHLAEDQKLLREIQAWASERSQAALAQRQQQAAQ